MSCFNSRSIPACMVRQKNLSALKELSNLSKNYLQENCKNNRRQWRYESINECYFISKSEKKTQSHHGINFQRNKIEQIWP